MMTDVKNTNPFLDIEDRLSRQRTFLAQARSKFIFLQANPHTYYTEDSVTKAVQEVRDAVEQAGVGKDLARLDRTGQTSTHDMETALADAMEAAMDFVREYNRNEFTM